MRKVAIVGLPNTGKSTLFNRLTRRRRALVHPVAGMTRDRLYGIVEHRGIDFTIIDTGGVTATDDPLQVAIQKQVAMAVTEADLVLVLLDAQEGPRPLDLDLLSRVRKAKPLIIAVNKIDAESHQARFAPFASLAREVYPISAEHAEGIDDLLDRIVHLLPEVSEAGGESVEGVTITIVGRPNAGKSTLLNRLVGYERASVSEVPGTTRDTIDAELRCGDRAYRILDTAGIRRKAKIDDSQEIIAVLAARKTIEKAHCTLLVLDGAAGISSHDRYLASEVATSARSCVVLVNKVDVAPSFDARAAVKQAHEALGGSLDWAQFLFISALDGRYTNRILKTVDQVVAEGSRQIPTPDLNRFLQRFFEYRTPLYTDSVRSSINYSVQVGRLPITIQLFTKRRSLLVPSYQKMLIKHLRREFGLKHSPIRIMLRHGRAPSA
ncbi:MAG: ribosome biogenesis GTPase Der [Acidobacteria bacterium]|nr:ribosome biogenesis GTPase Der [Acidobacteriota bacterium]